jgi:ubiquinone biosynthesis monooxygenase Coq7
MGKNGEAVKEIVRTEIVMDEFRIRGEGMSLDRLRKIKKGLRKLHTLELMAQTIYRFQIGGDDPELNCHLIVAMCNEMTHYQDFQVKLCEYGWRPSCLRWTYWIVGFCFGSFSKIFGEKMMLRTGIWTETLAVKGYGELLKEVDWDDETRKIIEKNWADEKVHVARWKYLLQTCNR